ncbi:MAG: hypothetical protein JO287_07130 [Pseudonocardiales bacterium]|nr:hypothetical protein [Pseudonocardiales bacterium]
MTSTGDVELDTQPLRREIDAYHAHQPRPDRLLAAVRSATFSVPSSEHGALAVVPHRGLRWLLVFSSTTELRAYQDRHGDDNLLRVRRCTGAWLLDKLSRRLPPGPPVAVMIDVTGSRPLSLPISGAPPSIGSSAARR